MSQLIFNLKNLVLKIKNKLQNIVLTNLVNRMKHSFFLAGEVSRRRVFGGTGGKVSDPSLPPDISWKLFCLDPV